MMHLSLTLRAAFYIVVLFLTVFSFIPHANGQLNQRNFIPVAPDELGTAFVRCIHKDSRGFMWFGTGTGLIRYDGTTVYRYEHVPGNNNSITDNRIIAIIEDADKNLWIGTAQGLLIYNREKDNFSNVDSIAQNKNHLRGQYISALCSDRSGKIWIGTFGQGLSVYDPKTFKFTYLTDSVTDNKVPDNFITGLLYADGLVWSGTKGGLKLYNAQDIRELPLRANNRSIEAKEITQLTQDARKNIWVATVDRQVIRLAHNGGDDWVDKTTPSLTPLMKTEGSIVTLAFDEKDNIWIAGENTGLIYLDIKSERVSHYEAGGRSPRNLPTNSIRSIYVDPTGMTWIGTYNRGVYMLDSHAKKFESFEHNEFSEAGMSGDNVKGLAEDHEGNIWLAVEGAGLAVLMANSNELRYDPDINNRIGTPHLSEVFLDRAGHLWIGTYGRGVYKVNLKSGDVQNYKIEINGFGDNKVSCLYQDSKKTIWAGSSGSGLFYFDPKSARFISLNGEKKADYAKMSSYVSSILEDADSSLWIGTLYGLYRLDRTDNDAYDLTVYLKTDKPGSIGSHYLHAIYQDRKKQLWFGTGDNGLAILPYGSDGFSNIQKQIGLISNSIRGILEDSKGHLWFSSNKGLSRYDPVKGSFQNYTKEDGLPSNDFNASSCLKARDGKFYFGTDRGLLVFHPDSIRNNPIKPAVYLTDLRLNNQSVPIDENTPLKQHISLTSALDLSYSQRSFAIDFVALNYGQSNRIQYCYKLEGFDNDWNCAGTNTRATYTNIDPGDYVFLVKASNSDGLSSEPARLGITIHQTPWKTWWAYLLYLALFALVTSVLFRSRIERLRIKNQLELERLARENEHALSESKIQFFTNISHEFRTPLSLIMMPLESLISMNDLAFPVKERLATIRSSADKMMRLVNELMDFSKLEGTKLKLRIQQGELVQFITAASSGFYEVAAKRNIHFGIHSMVPSLQGWFDHDKLDKILVNVLSNAFKFTADNGQINVIINSRQSIAGKEQMNTRWLELTVVDNGIGIPQDELPLIFDKFYQAKSPEKIANSGTGIGLSLTKGLVDLHSGFITAESTPASETKFLIYLPIDRHVYDDGDICEIPSPVVKANITEQVVVHDPHSVTDEDQSKPQILIVEDNDELRKYISLELQQQFIVLEASDGKQGLEVALERTPDLIISDILMPVKSGIELCKEIKSNIETSHIPFILLTAKARVDDQIEGITTGADIYITKPFSIRFLIAHVNQIIESRQKLYSRFSQDVYLLPSKVATNEIDQEFLEKAIDYIVQNLQTSQLGVDSIAELFNLSRMHVYRKIKALTGKSVVEFIRMVRVKQAVKLMDTHKYTLSEIAYQTGFNSPSYFTRVFKEEYGKTPTEYLERSS